MSDLAESADSISTYLKFYLGEALQATDGAQIGAAGDAACTYFQGLGICELLLDAEVTAFFHHMIRSGRMRRWVLRKAQQLKDLPPNVLRASNTRGLFAALLADDRALAADIARLSPMTWNDRVEYEDDFLYAHFLHRLISGDDSAALRGILDKFKRALDDEETVRFRLCASLLAPSQERAGLALPAFEDLMQSRRQELKEMREKSILATDDMFVPFSSVYVEGLAWLNLLEGAGITVDSEYAFCPSLARVKPYPQLAPEVFPD